MGAESDISGVCLATTEGTAGALRGAEFRAPRLPRCRREHLRRAGKEETWGHQEP